MAIAFFGLAAALGFFAAAFFAAGLAVFFAAFGLDAFLAAFGFVAFLACASDQAAHSRCELVRRRHNAARASDSPPAS